MTTVYKFAGFPRQIGFVVGEGDLVHQAASEALEEWAQGAITKENLLAYMSSGQIEQVKLFPDTDAGYHEATEFAEEMEKY